MDREGVGPHRHAGVPSPMRGGRGTAAPEREPTDSLPPTRSPRAFTRWVACRARTTHKGRSERLPTSGGHVMRHVGDTHHGIGLFG